MYDAVVVAQEELAARQVDEAAFVLEERGTRGLAFGSRAGRDEGLFAVEPHECDAVPLRRLALTRSARSPAPIGESVACNCE